MGEKPGKKPTKRGFLRIICWQRFVKRIFSEVVHWLAFLVGLEFSRGTFSVRPAVSYTANAPKINLG